MTLPAWMHPTATLTSSAGTVTLTAPTPAALYGAIMAHRPADGQPARVTITDTRNGRTHTETYTC